MTNRLTISNTFPVMISAGTEQRQAIKEPIPMMIVPTRAASLYFPIIISFLLCDLFLRACPQDVLAVNKSVTALVEAVTQNQMLLKSKLEKVLEFCPLPPPPPPPCKPEPVPCPPPCSCPSQHPDPCPAPCPVPHKTQSCEKSSLRLVGQREQMIWNPDCRLPWRTSGCFGKDICWDRRVPTRIQLNPGKAYVIQYTLNVRAMCPAKGAGTICIRQSPCGMFADTPPLHFSMEHLIHGSQPLHHIAVLHPRTDGGSAAELSLVLDAETPLCVERAEMDVAEL